MSSAIGGMVFRMGRWLNPPDSAGARVESLFLIAVLVAPWPYALAPEWGRFALTAVLLAGVGSWLVASGSAPRVPRTGAYWAAVGALLLAVSGATFGPAKIDSGLYLLACVALTAFWAAHGHADAALRAAICVVVSAVAQALFAVWQWHADPATIYGRQVAAASPFGSFVNHNHFAGFAGMAALVAAGMAVRAWKLGVSVRLVLSAGAALVLALAVLASHSRGGVVALTAGCAALGVRPRTSGRFRWSRWVPAVAVLALVLGLTLLPDATAQRMTSVFRGTGDPSLHYRIDTVWATLRLASSSPILGVGLGSFEDAVTRFKTGHGHVRVTHAECDVLEFVAETGLLGAAVLVVAAAAGVRRIRRRLLESRRGSGVVYGSFAAVVAMSVYSLFDFNLRIPSNALVFCTLLGILIRGAPSPSGVPTLPPRFLRACGALLMVLGAVAAWRGLGAVELDAARSRADPWTRLARLDRALARHPCLAEAYALRATTRLELARGTPAERHLGFAFRDLQASLQCRPEWAEAWTELGRVQHLRGAIASAEAALDRAVQLDPTHIGIGVARAVFFEKTGRPERAEAELKRLERANPGLPAANAERLARAWLGRSSAKH